METDEHIEVGNAIVYDSLFQNPYLRVDEEGTLHVTLMKDEENLPIPLPLELSAGQIIAMAGDYYTSPGWAMSLDVVGEHPEETTLGLQAHVLDDDVLEKEYQAFIEAFDSLASDEVTKKDIDKIIAISGRTYIPFSKDLNSYLQQLILTFNVKDYREKLEKNEAHFTPWAKRAYIIGHTLAIQQAKIAYALRLLAAKQSEKISVDLNFPVQGQIKTTAEVLQEMSHRYHAMAVAMELFTMHYYSDAFAPGHMSRMGFLRTELPRKFGMWGSILVNDQHNEDNRVVLVVNSDNDPNSGTPAQGDGHVDSRTNEEHKKNCIKAMSASMADIEKVLQTGELIECHQFGGLGDFPDINYSHRQPQPMFLLYKNKIYARDPIQEIRILSPTEYHNLLMVNPKKQGYKKLRNRFDAFKLVCKLRLLPFIYRGKVIEPSSEQWNKIFEEESSNQLQGLSINPSLVTLMRSRTHHESGLQKSTKKLQTKIEIADNREKGIPIPMIPDYSRKLSL